MKRIRVESLIPMILLTSLTVIAAAQETAQTARDLSRLAEPQE